MAEDNAVVSQQQQQMPIAGDAVVADGEYHQLIQSLEEEDDVAVAAPGAFEVPSNDVALKSRINYDNAESWYGHPLSIEEAREQMSDGNISYRSHSSSSNKSDNSGGGLLWNITIIPNEMLNSTTTLNGSLASPSTSIKRSHGLNHRDFTISRSSTLPSSEEQPQQPQMPEFTGNVIQIKPRRPSLPRRRLRRQKPSSPPAQRSPPCPLPPAP